MKKILSLLLLIGLLLPNVSFAYLGNKNGVDNNYISVYSKYGGFRNAHNFIYIYGNYRITAKTTDISYIRNFRIFIPNFTIKTYMSIQRRGSQGWMDVLVTMGKYPSLGTNNEYKDGDYTISINKYGENYDDNINKIKFTFARGYPNWLELFNEGWTLRYWNERRLGWNSEYNSEQMKKFNKWIYVATDTRPSRGSDNTNVDSRNTDVTNPLTRLTTRIIYDLDKTAIDNEVKKYNLDKKFKNECLKEKEEVKNLCYYIKSFGSDGIDNQISTNKQTAEGYYKNTENPNNENQTTTQTPPTKPSIDVLTPNSTKKTSTISLQKGLNLVGFKGDTKLSDLNGCNIGKYTKGQYNGKKSIFGVKGQNFIITPNNAETSTFTDEMGIFIFVKGDCKLKYSYSK